MPWTMWVMTPPPVLVATSLPVDLAMKDLAWATGLPSMVTVTAPPCKSMACAVLGNGVGMGPDGGGGGHRQTSGKAMDLPAEPEWMAARPLMKTLSAMIPHDLPWPAVGPSTTAPRSRPSLVSAARLGRLCTPFACRKASIAMARNPAAAPVSPTEKAGSSTALVTGPLARRELA